MKTLILATIFVLTPPQSAQQRNGSIEGRVTQWGTDNPIRNVEILVQGAGEGRTPIFWQEPQAISDANGRFVIHDVPPGVYTIQAQRGGFTNPAPNAVRVKEGGRTRTVTVASGQRVENADLAMVRAGAVSGRLTNSLGKPASRTVIAVSVDEVDYRYSETDDRGEYHLTGIQPGKYYVFAEASDGEAQTYFPGLTDKSKAAVLDIAEGAVLSQMDFITQVDASKTFKISGKIVSPDGSSIEGFLSGIRLSPRASASKSDYRESGGGGSDDNAPSIDFYLTGVRPGSYDLYVSVGKTMNSFESGVVGRVAVDIHNEDVDIKIVTGGVGVKGRFIVPANATIPSGAVSLKIMPAELSSRKFKTDATGAFTIPNIFSGTWKLDVSDLPANVALLDIRQSGNSVYENGFAVGDRPTEPLQVVLGAAGTVAGTVRTTQGAIAGAAHVILIPKDPNPAEPARDRKAITDGAGRFTFGNVAVGAYTIVAFDAAPESNALRTGATVNVADGAEAQISIAATRITGAER